MANASPTHPGRNIGHWDEYYDYVYACSEDYDLFAVGAIGPIAGQITADHSIGTVHSGAEITATVFAASIGDVIDLDSDFIAQNPAPTPPPSVAADLQAEIDAVHDLVLADKLQLQLDAAAALVHFTEECLAELANINQTIADTNAANSELQAKAADALASATNDAQKTLDEAAEAAAAVAQSVEDAVDQSENELHAARSRVESARKKEYNRAIKLQNAVAHYLTETEDPAMVQALRETLRRSDEERESRQRLWQDWAEEMATLASGISGYDHAFYGIWNDDWYDWLNPGMSLAEQMSWFTELWYGGWRWIDLQAQYNRDRQNAQQQAIARDELDEVRYGVYQRLGQGCLDLLVDIPQVPHRVALAGMAVGEIVLVATGAGALVDGTVRLAGAGVRRVLVTAARGRLLTRLSARHSIEIAYGRGDIRLSPVHMAWRVGEVALHATETKSLFYLLNRRLALQMIRRGQATTVFRLQRVGAKGAAEFFAEAEAAGRVIRLPALNPTLALKSGHATLSCVTSTWNAWSLANYHLPNLLIGGGAVYGLYEVFGE